jgi:hypothetical protein
VEKIKKKRTFNSVGGAMSHESLQRTIFFAVTETFNSSIVERFKSICLNVANKILKHFPSPYEMMLVMIENKFHKIAKKKKGRSIEDLNKQIIDFFKKRGT